MFVSAHALICATTTIRLLPMDAIRDARESYDATAA
jgi:hypothetical protein